MTAENDSTGRKNIFEGFQLLRRNKKGMHPVGVDNAVFASLKYCFAASDDQNSKILWERYVRLNKSSMFGTLRIIVDLQKKLPIIVQDSQQ